MNQPDAILLIDASAGGQSFSEKMVYRRCPNWLQKLPPAAAIDLATKVCLSQWGAEYLVWQVFDQQIDWFSLQNADYMTLPLRGWCDCTSLSGLWLDIVAMLDGNSRKFCL